MKSKAWPYVVWVLLQCVCAPSGLAQNLMHLIGHIDQPHGVTAQLTKYAGCWGWVSPDGKEYGIVATYSGVSIIDLNGDTLREAAFVPGPKASYAYHEIKTYKQYAYVVSEGSYPGGTAPIPPGMQIIDLSYLPDSAHLVKEFTYTDLNGGTNGRSHTLSYADGYLYCNGSNTWSPGGVLVFSLRKDPLNPEFIAAYEPQYVHDSYIRNDMLYASAIYPGGGLLIYNIADKTNPLLLGKIEYSGSGTHNSWTSVDGKYVFTADEIGATAHDVKIWDISDIRLPARVGEYSALPTKAVHNVRGRGNYLYVSHYLAGMRVLDIHDPVLWQEVGSYDTYPDDDINTPPYNGCWDIFPYFPSGRILGSDMQTGTYLCTFDSLMPRTRSHLLAPGITPISSDTIRFRWTSSANQQADPHHYDLHIIGNGIDTSFSTPDTTYTLAASSLFRTTGSYTWHVMTSDEFTSVSSIDTMGFTYNGAVVGVGEPHNVPGTFSLRQNYPNPFNPSTNISFTLEHEEHVSLKIYDLLGAEVGAPLQNVVLGPGVHEVIFSAATLASGIYTYRLVTDSNTELRRMNLVR